MQLELGKEYPEQGERENTLAIIEIIRRNLEKRYKNKHVNRQFHAKMHACIKGIFTIDATLPAEMQAGAFVAGKSYECWVRLSNGNPQVVDDRKADLRGFAIKLTGVEGDQLVGDISMPGSHDFLLVSYPTLMADTIKNFKKCVASVCGGLIGIIGFSLNPFNWGIAARTLASMKKQNNLFSLSYWSVSPYKYGTGDLAVKYRVTPTSRNLTKPAIKNANFFRDTIVTDLAAQNITFDFEVQFQEDADKNQIEKPTVEWQSPFHKIGSLVLPRQQFVPDATQQFGDNLTYSPWHCRAEHQPLGAINRVRKEVYDAISKFRIEQNLKNQEHDN